MDRILDWIVRVLVIVVCLFIPFLALNICNNSVKKQEEKAEHKAYIERLTQECIEDDVPEYTCYSILHGTF